MSVVEVEEGAAGLSGPADSHVSRMKNCADEADGKAGFRFRKIDALQALREKRRAPVNPTVSRPRDCSPAIEEHAGSHSGHVIEEEVIVCVPFVTIEVEGVKRPVHSAINRRAL